MADTHLAIILGTRPEMIKLSPVIRVCEQRDISYTLVHTGQHYSDELDSVFFERLDLPEPEYHLDIGSGSHGEQTGKMLIGIEDVILTEDVEFVLVQGDTNSVLAGAIATSKLDAELGHIEAGLRSFDRNMPEEINRVVTDHVGDYLFAPTEETASLLRDEGVDESRIYVTGNTVVDAVQAYRQIAAEKSSVLDEHALSPGEFVLMTAHRAENVDNPDRLTDLLAGIDRVARELDHPVIYPIHPRTQDRLNEFDVTVPDAIRPVDPLDFLDFLRLEDTASLVITDSGGVQEETCILQTPCVTVRDSTERPETVAVGANVVVGTDPSDIANGARKQLAESTDWEAPFGDGNAAERILDVIR
ncbi:UDP-N-acetylglucosamine 2-epimerase (non-hydrolyzing) [Halobacterium salinarum]|uniref:non-hydrolyzing UDP-N-acetylglucosamine 2-epimerase n=1 Tax=Halobacterium salinarum TaxID=2242 RepID=UPI0025567510|nr:UDP-N-acetylglucosamine 2-epimerase (non-hydrolyzing) [Halobacterium salinarum]MDL0138589.1 UDP-N-acetylglucosamine 2-epimerase (non-hydrolyzing) [Halobacterium salinarum]